MSRTPRYLVLVLTLAIGCWAGAAMAAVKLPTIIGGDMVLQQGCPVPIWGWADKGEEVTVNFAGQSVSGKAGDDGRWEVKLAKLEATPNEKPLEMTIKGSSGEPITLKNILVGEVWICSGQSNMEMGIGIAQNAPAEIKAADYPNIRLFTVTKSKVREPASDVKGSWAECNSKTISTGGWGGFSAAAYYFGRDLYKKLKVPVGLIHTSWGGTAAELWTSKKALEANPLLKDLAGHGENSSLYNGMIAPLVPFAIRGAIWYQGEANVGRAAQYRELLPTMIRNWRSEWKQGDFPFGVVQIAPFDYHGGIPEAELWESQVYTAESVPNTGLITTMDIGELKNIHPKNKQEVGRRLAMWALAKVYGENVEYSGPIYKSMEIDGDKIKISFDHLDGGLKSRDGKPLTEFTITGPDGKFQPAKAEIEGSTVVVESDKVSNPVAVRFAFHDTAQPNLESKEGLPAVPFRTDSGLPPVRTEQPGTAAKTPKSAK
ncbi:MAG TPA: sialate O-acetylesterase [Pirellulales bacterium]|jgi:sialate O-acetylesterase|nr:sialate O-acetylesterase [Pirellulales bacterium]